MTTGPLTHRATVNIPEVLFHCIPHSTLGIIHIPGHHTNKRHSYVVQRHIGITPFQFLHAEYSFEIDRIRESTVDSGRFIHTVKIHEQLIFCSSFRDPVNHLYRFLIIPVEEVDFEALNPHTGIIPASLFELLVQHVHHRPQNQSDPFVAGIFGQFR